MNRATRKHAVKGDEGENLEGKYNAEELFTDARAECGIRRFHRKWEVGRESSAFLDGVLGRCTLLRVPGAQGDALVINDEKPVEF